MKMENKFQFSTKRDVWSLYIRAPKSQDWLKWLLPDGSTGKLMVRKAFYLNLVFNFLNRISLLLISSSYQILLTKLSWPLPDTILPEKFLWYTRKSNLESIWWQSDVLTTISKRQSLLLLLMIIFREKFVS